MNTPPQAPVWLAWLVAAVGMGCTPHQAMPYFTVEATIEPLCVSGGGMCPAVNLNFEKPHCGYGVGASSDSPVRVMTDLSKPVSLTALVDVKATLMRPDGGRSPAVSWRSGVATTVRVFGGIGVGSVPLYDLTSSGVMVPVTADAEVLDAGIARFRYSASAADGGTTEVVETHAIVSSVAVEAELFDPSGGPFDACCTHVPWETPLSIAGVLLLMRRRRMAS